MSYAKATIYKTQPTSTGHLMYLSTGCGIVNESVFKTTAASTAIPNYGVTMVQCTAACSMAAPYKGALKTLIFRGSTKAMKIKTSPATINSATGTVLAVTLGTTKTKRLGFRVDLIGYSTVLWYSGISGSSNVTTTLTTAT